MSEPQDVEARSFTLWRLVPCVDMTCWRDWRGKTIPQRLVEEARFALAALVNRRRGSCWADLATWALGYGGSLLGTSSACCVREAHEQGQCYCGKFCRRDMR